MNTSRPSVTDDLQFSTSAGRTWQAFVADSATDPDDTLLWHKKWTVYQEAAVFAHTVEALMASGHSFENAIAMVYHFRHHAMLRESEAFRTATFNVLNGYWKYAANLRQWCDHSSPNH